MVAYAALLSLLQLLDTILHPGARGRRIYHNRPQLESFHEKVSFLLDFLENSPPRGENHESELGSVETKIRYTANQTKNVIESGIFHQQSTKPAPDIIVFTCVFANVTVQLFQTFFPVMPFYLISVLSFLPVNFQIVLFVVARMLTNLAVDLEPFLFLIAYAFLPFLMLKSEASTGTSLATYWLYASEPENQDLCVALEDFSFIVKEVIRIKDDSGSGLDQDRMIKSLHSAHGLSRWHFRGTEKNVVVGLDGLLKQIHDPLLGHEPELQTVSMVGMGGIGKTTLARLVYDDPRMVYHFDICAWITVSQKYSLRHVMLGLLDSAKISTEEILQNHREDDLDQRLGELLYRNLISRRFLIVMDDVWDTEVWDSVRLFFPDNNNGSRVLLTSRLTEVASYANPHTPSIQMPFLNDVDSWNLLREKVFGGEDCPPELESIGRTISGNCRGLPLAIVVVGGLLYEECRAVGHWERVSNNLSLILSGHDEQCLGILGLSYDHLPHHLKACFLYMGSFGEDEEIHVTRLFNLWVAEGFLKPCKAKNLEEVAEEYLKDLIQRSLVLVGRRSLDGKIKTCKIHDLIRDVCWLKAQKENFLYHARDRDYGADIQHTVRALFDFGYASDDDSRRSCVMSRSYIYAGRTLDDLSHIYKDLCFLRVLDVVPANLNEFPDEVFRLVHIRYLGLTYGNCLPAIISQLWNLQTIVHHGRRFGSNLLIPMEIWSMPSLRHLYFKRDLLPDPPARITTILENLQTLVGISSFRCTNSILRSIPNLKKLVIFYEGTVDWSEYQLESVKNFHQLEILKITVFVEWALHVRPPKLAFPERIKKLSLSGCRMGWESMMRTVGALPNLEVLKLRNHACEGQIWKTVEGHFCQLMFLLLDDLNLELWRAEEAHFPRLRRLILRRLRKLEEIPCDMGEIATLEVIELVGCHPSALASARQIQEEQLSMGNEYLKIYI